MDWVGTLVGPYRIIEAIGQGGMAAVFKAYQPALDRHVAIKVLSAQRAAMPGFSERFEREAKAIAQLNHPNILPVIDYGRAEGLTYIVMKYVPGGTLADRLRRPLDLVSIVHLVGQIAAALDHAHGRGVIHRDVKPSNVLLDEGEWVQLADFGLARMMRSESDLTGTGMSMGTPAYLSPEQAQGLALDQHTDIYSLGVMVYEMVAGQLPFLADSPMAVVFKHIYEPPPVPRSVKPELPEAIESVLMRGVAKSIAERFPSAGDLARALREAVARSSSDAALRLAGVPDPRATPLFGVREPAAPMPTVPHNLLMMESVPSLPHFVGRETELAAYRARLERDRFLVITGMAGVGKTTLGAKLAREHAERGARVFWFTFDRVEKVTADALFWALAVFLDSHGDSDLWRYLRGEIDAQKALDRTVRLNLLLSGLASGEYVLCFDDVQIVGDVPDIAHVFELLRQRFVDQRQDIPARILIMGREAPADLEALAAGTLRGFSRDEAQAFLAARDLSLPESLFGQLWERTEGNAKLLELSAAALAATPSSLDSFFQALARKGDVRDYVMTNIYAALRPEERAVMGVLSVFPGSVEREAAEHVLDAEGVTGIAPRLDALISRHLIHEADDDRLRCHSLVREYGYHVLDRKDRERYHQHAAAYYEQERNFLSAAHHHFERRAFGRALELLTTESQAIINAGGAGALLEQLARFERHVLTADQQAARNRARGDALLVRGEYQPAIEAYTSALEVAASGAQRAELSRLIGGVHQKMGRYGQALEFAEHSLTASDTLGFRPGVARAHHDLGWALLRLGRLDEARAHFDAGRQVGQSLGDQVLLAEIDLGAGVLAWRAGEVESARAAFENSRRVFRDAGERVKEAYAVANLGVIYRALDDPERERSCYEQALDIQAQIGDVEGLRGAYNNLGYLHHGLGEFDRAIAYYGELARLAESTGHHGALSLAHAGLADAYLGTGDTLRALDHASIAHKVAQDSGAASELGTGCRVLGDVWLRLGRFEEARACFERGIPLLQEAHETEELAKAARGREQAARHLDGGSLTTSTGG